jgi:eukaryotic-like serine/threonine-protein kinase
VNDRPPADTVGSPARDESDFLSTRADLPTLPMSAEIAEQGSPSDCPPHLRLFGEIARGGMGCILKGRDVELGRELAVKVLRETHQDNPELARRFLEEAQIAGQLQHPGITPVYELGSFADGRPYFTMKLVRGKTLAELLAARADVLDDRPRFLGVFEQVCQTVAYAHARGVIHRDLKPSNIMVGAFGEVQVMDWGLAKVLPQASSGTEAQGGERERTHDTSVICTARSGNAGATESGWQTEAGALLGTPAYMPPEQARGDVELLDERADVFGLGAILCVILTGQPPFTGPRDVAHDKASAARLDDACARLDGCGADAELVALAKRCLAVEPSARPRQASEVAEQMTAYQHAVVERLRQAEVARAAEEARALEARATAAQERKARRMTVALAGSLMPLLLLGGSWWWLQGQLAARRADNNRTVHEALVQARLLRQQAWATQGRSSLESAVQARALVQRAEAIIESGSVDAELTEQIQDLLAELDTDQRDRELLTALDEARLAQARRFSVPLLRSQLRKAFRSFGLPVGAGEPAAMAERLRNRPPGVREAVLASLDEWITQAENAPHDKHEMWWLRGVLAALEPGSWEEQVRNAAAETDAGKRRAALQQLAATADVEHLPAHTLTRLAARLQNVQAEASAAALLRRAQVWHADDFWINETLGIVLKKSDPAEALRYLTAAVSLRPDSANAHNNLGFALGNQGKLEEASAEYRRAIDLDPKDAAAHYSLAAVLAKQGKPDEALVEHQKAIDLDPKLAGPHNALGGPLKEQGKEDEGEIESRSPPSKKSHHESHESHE